MWDLDSPTIRPPSAFVEFRMRPCKWLTVNQSCRWDCRMKGIRRNDGPVFLRLHTARRMADYSRVHLLRSEEHTSELQSRENLVCRLLLEKKKYPFSEPQYELRRLQ